MLKRFRSDPLIGNVLALIALCVAVGLGTAYAAGLAPNSVRSKHIKDENVKTADLAPGSVTSSRLALNSILSELVPDDELTGADIAELTGADIAELTGADIAELTGADIDEDSLSAVPDADQLDGHDSSIFQTKGTGSWTALDLNQGIDPAAITPTPGFSCNWGWVGGGNTAAFFRDQDGFVHLRGRVVAYPGTNACGTFDRDDTIGNLPPGYRPDTDYLFDAASHYAPGRAFAMADGRVALDPPFDMYLGGVWVSLDGLSFRCAPAGSNGCP